MVRQRARVVSTAPGAPTVELAARTFDGCVSTSLHIAPNIPPGKAQGAIGQYAPQVKESEILMLFDPTLFATATDGFLLTAAENLWHNAMSLAACRFAPEALFP